MKNRLWVLSVCLLLGGLSAEAQPDPDTYEFKIGSIRILPKSGMGGIFMNRTPGGYILPQTMAVSSVEILGGDDFEKISTVTPPAHVLKKLDDDVDQKYLDHLEAEGQPVLGDVFVVEQSLKGIFITAHSVAMGATPDKFLYVTLGGADEGEEFEVVKRSFFNALVEAEELGIDKIATPLMGVGNSGNLDVPWAARAMIEAIRDFSQLGGEMEAILIYASEEFMLGSELGVILEKCWKHIKGSSIYGLSKEKVARIVRAEFNKKALSQDQPMWFPIMREVGFDLAQVVEGDQVVLAMGEDLPGRKRKIKNISGTGDSKHLIYDFSDNGESVIQSEIDASRSFIVIPKKLKDRKIFTHKELLQQAKLFAATTVTNIDFMWEMGDLGLNEYVARVGELTSLQATNVLTLLWGLPADKQLRARRLIRAKKSLKTVRGLLKK